MAGIQTIVLAAALTATFAAFALAVLFVFNERRRYARHRRVAQSDGADDDDSGEPTITIAIFHPYANGGGGGERVLYCALLALVQHFEQQHSTTQHQHERNQRVELLLYTGDDGLSAKQLIERAAERFNLPALLAYNVSDYVRLVVLPNRALLEPGLYPRFTLFWQSVAHVRLALAAFHASEALGCYPHIWLDTTGCAFTYIVACILYNCRVVAYVHYPMISTDMLAKVQTRASDYNNKDAVAQSKMRSLIKLVYYHLFAAAYALVGKSCTDIVMVNSTWTFNHIAQLWGGSPAIVYPPCGVIDAAGSDHSDVQRKPVALSIAQFRPEKNHLLQLEALSLVCTTHADAMATTYKDFKLVLLGSCRNSDDDDRVDALRQASKALGIDDRVTFAVNASFADLTSHVATASIGLHTMANEHFGISIVEMMAAGIVVIANNSGGPAADIVKHGTGFLATTAAEYAEMLFAILEMDATRLRDVRQQAQQAATRFSDTAFQAQFLAAITPVLTVASVDASDKDKMS